MPTFADAVGTVNVSEVVPVGVPPDVESAVLEYHVSVTVFEPLYVTDAVKDAV